MGKSEIKCRNCGQWTPGSESYCVHCNTLVDPQIIDRKEREVRAYEEEKRWKQGETRFEKLLTRLRSSENPLARLAYVVFRVVWVIYLGLMAFVIWFTSIFSG